MRKLLRAIRTDGPISRAELSRRLTLSKVTTSSLVLSLLERGILAEVGTTSRGSGRRAVLVDLDPRLGVTAAADVNAGIVRVSVNDFHGNSVRDHAFATPASLDRFVGSLTENLHATVERAGRSLCDVRHICLSVPATVERTGELKVPFSPGYLSGINIRQRLAESFSGIPCTAINDMNAAALAEHHEGAARDFREFAYFGVRESGVGIGLVLHNRLFLGARGFAGEVGALRVDGSESRMDTLFSRSPRKSTLKEAAHLLVTTLALLDLEGIVAHADSQEGFDLIDALEKELADIAPYSVRLVPGMLREYAMLRGASLVSTRNGWRQLYAAHQAPLRESSHEKGGFVQ